MTTIIDRLDYIINDINDLRKDMYDEKIGCMKRIKELK